MATYLGNGQFRIQSGDTLWGLAQQYLGSGSRYGEIQGYGGNARSMPIGTVVTVPNYRGPGEVGSATPPAPVAPAATQTITNEATKYIDDAKSEYTAILAKWKESLPKPPGPFEFDEKQAKEQVVAEGKIPQYYQEKLQNYLTDVQTQRRQYLGDVTSNLDTTNTNEQRKKIQAERALAESLRQAENGFANRDAYFSSDRITTENRIQVPVQEFIQNLARDSQIERLQQQKSAIEQLGYEGAVASGIVQAGEDPIAQLMQMQNAPSQMTAQVAPSQYGQPGTNMANLSQGIQGQLPTSVDRYQKDIANEKETSLLDAVKGLKSDALGQRQLEVDEYNQAYQQKYPELPSLSNYM